MSINKVILVGYAAGKPEMRYFDDGNNVATFRMGTTEKGYTGQNGIKVPDRTEWHTIVVWRHLAKIAEQYVKKGSQIYIEGKVHYRPFETANGKRYATEIHAFTLTLLSRGNQEDRKYNNEVEEDKSKESSEDG